jgi:predicted nucleic acid-binding protein
LHLLSTRYTNGASIRDIKRKHGKKENEIRWLVESFPEKFEIVQVKPETGRTSTVLRLKK